MRIAETDRTGKRPWAFALFAAPLLGLAWGHAAAGQGKAVPQETFPAPQVAAEALGAGYQRGDRETVAAILGDKAWRLVFSGDSVIDRHERAWFLSLYREGHGIAAESDSRAVLTLGRDEVPYPVPLVKRGSRWRFDPGEGHEDLLSQRISKTELSALNAMVAYVAAQCEYQKEPRRGNGVREYTSRLRSSPGQRDGLIWEGQAGKRAGPLAELAEVASKEGYSGLKAGELPIYRGYVFKMLSAQGPHAAGGARDYVVGGRMTGGFALAAFPIRYGISGVMTFLVNQEGVVCQKDLGPKTTDLGRQMTQFDPDATWTKGQAD